MHAPTAEKLSRAPITLTCQSIAEAPTVHLTAGRVLRILFEVTRRSRLEKAIRATGISVGSVVARVEVVGEIEAPSSVLRIDVATCLVSIIRSDACL
jgi:hypothetical protein